MASTITWDLPAAARMVTVCRNTLKTYLSEHSICQEDIENLQIILGELCANVVRHAYTDPDRTYRIRVRHNRWKLALDIIDKGVGFDLTNPKQHCETYEGCGVGLALIRELASSTSIVSVPGKGSTVHVEYDLHCQEDVAAMSLPS